MPFFYGIVEIICLGIYCVGAWKAGWTKAPPEEPLWRVLTCSYEVLVAESLEKNKVDVEVKLGHDTELEDEEYVNVAGCGGCLYYCHNPCIDDFDLESMDHNKRVKRGPKEESFVPITLQADYLKSLGYKVKDDSML